MAPADRPTRALSPAPGSTAHAVPGQALRNPMASRGCASQWRRQVAQTEAVVRWYLGTYFGKPEDLGTASSFCDPVRVGAFAPNLDDIRAGRSEALFKLLVMMTLFQRRQDQQVFRILRAISTSDVREMTDSNILLQLAGSSPCSLLKSVRGIHDTCDLSKDQHGRPCCATHPDLKCQLKRHSKLLKRYADFGKVPTSAALVLVENGDEGLSGLRKRVLATPAAPLARSEMLLSELSRMWRVSLKIASMFLSAVTNPDLEGASAVWREGLDWRRFVVIDSNTERFLTAVGFNNAGGYAGRRAVIEALAAEIDLRRLNPDLQSNNPRLVQQAMYMFMSAPNRRANPTDCWSAAPASCLSCELQLRRACPRR